MTMAEENRNIIPKADNIAERAAQIGMEDADDLAVLNFVAQMQTARATTRMLRLAEAKIPTGFRHFEYTILVGETLVIQLGVPWISFTIHNKSATTGFFMAINDRDRLNEDAPIAPLKSANIAWEFPLIKTIYLKVDGAVDVPVEIWAIEGKKEW